MHEGNGKMERSGPSYSMGDDSQRVLFAAEKIKFSPRLGAGLLTGPTTYPIEFYQIERLLCGAGILVQNHTVS